MTAIYRIGSNGEWTGEQTEIGAVDPMAPGWTTEAPPSLSAGQVAVMGAKGWVAVAAHILTGGGGSDPSNGIVAQAQAALDAATNIYTLCGMSNVDWPDTWVAYTRALNAIISNGTGELPAVPDRPAGI